jgi:hypothetical protein
MLEKLKKASQLQKLWEVWSNLASQRVERDIGWSSDLKETIWNWVGITCED